MRIFDFLAALAISAAQSWDASAITLTSRDQAERKLTLIEGDKQTELKLKPGEKADVCQNGCVIRMPNGDDYDFEGQETVFLEDGILYIEAQEAKPAR